MMKIDPPSVEDVEAILQELEKALRTATGQDGRSRTSASVTGATSGDQQHRS